MGIKMIEEILEINKLKENLMEYAYTDFAKERIQNLTPFLSEKEVILEQRQTTEAKQMIEKMGNPPLTALENTEEYLDVAEKGGYLSIEQLEHIAAVLATVKRLKDFLNRTKHLDISIPYYEENLDAMEEVRDEIERVIRNGKVDDFASKKLRTIRGEIENLEAKMREKAEAILRSNKDIMAEQFSTIRNGRICVPVKKEYKLKIPGSVIEQSATGHTLFIEPSAVSKFAEELQLKRLEEENEVIRILYTVTAMLSDASVIFLQNKTTIEKLDYIFAKGKLSIDYDGIEPKIIVSERKISIKNGRHPLMKKEVCVPLNFNIGGGVNGIIITGPNTGGKTVAIKTVGILCYMAQCGLHVSCEKAEICMNSQFLCDIGDGQNLSENLSTFSAHIKNVLDILKRSNRESLVILDELGSGTDPTEGMGIAIAILEELKKSGALYLATTHYPEVKNYAEKEKNVINARMAFDRESLRPLYQLEIGKAGESCALYIAAKLGMPKNMLIRAEREAYGSEQQYFLPEGIVESIQHEHTAKIMKQKEYKKKQERAGQFCLGDSVMVYPDKKIGIVCQTANEKGVLRVQMQNRKIWINHKRVKLHVAAAELYPEDYDFSIIFDSVENRKARHQMDKKHDAKIQITIEKGEA